MVGALRVGRKAHAPEHRCLSEAIINWMGIQTQNFARSNYIQPHRTFEAKGHLLGAHRAGGREVCASNSEAGRWRRARLD